MNIKFTIFQFPIGFSRGVEWLEKAKEVVHFQFPIGFSQMVGKPPVSVTPSLSIPYRILTKYGGLYTAKP